MKVIYERNDYQVRQEANDCTVWQWVENVGWIQHEGGFINLPAAVEYINKLVPVAQD